MVGKCPVSMCKAEPGVVLQSTFFEAMLQRLMNRWSPRQPIGALSDLFYELASPETSFSHLRSSSTGRREQLEFNRLRFAL
jgi:hypothetical protein